MHNIETGLDQLLDYLPNMHVICCAMHVCR